MTIIDESDELFLVDVQLENRSFTVQFPKNLIHKLKNGTYKVRLSDMTSIMT
jgi:hypothetical protein